MENVSAKVTEIVDLATLPYPPDMLREMMARQKEFQERMETTTEVKWGGFPLCELDTVVVESWVQTWAEAILMEACELKDWTRWKHWSQQLGNKKPIQPGSEEHIKEMRIEVADLFCFLMNAALALGMTAEDIYQEHAAKLSVNHARQDSGSY